MNIVYIGVPYQKRRTEGQIKANKALANKWTDNVFQVKCYLKKRMPNMTNSEMDKTFGIPDDFDNIQ